MLIDIRAILQLLLDLLEVAKAARVRKWRVIRGIVVKVLHRRHGCINKQTPEHAMTRESREARQI